MLHRSSHKRAAVNVDIGLLPDTKSGKWSRNCSGTISDGKGSVMEYDCLLVRLCFRR